MIMTIKSDKGPRNIGEWSRRAKYRRGGSRMWWEWWRKRWTDGLRRFWGRTMMMLMLDLFIVALSLVLTVPIWSTSIKVQSLFFVLQLAKSRDSSLLRSKSLSMNAQGDIAISRPLKSCLRSNPKKLYWNILSTWQYKLAVVENGNSQYAYLSHWPTWRDIHVLMHLQSSSVNPKMSKTMSSLASLSNSSETHTLVPLSIPTTPILLHPSS